MGKKVCYQKISKNPVDHIAAPSFINRKRKFIVCSRLQFFKQTKNTKYKIVVQDETQSYHWASEPVKNTYYKTDNKVQSTVLLEFLAVYCPCLSLPKEIH